MKQNSTLETWWNSLLKQHNGHMGAGYDLLEHLDKTLENCEPEEKKDILDFMTQKVIQKDKTFRIALNVLENHGTEHSVEQIFTIANTLDFSDFDIVYYLRVIGKKGNENHKKLIEAFLLSPKINPNHSAVHWSTYPHFPDLFGKAYSKYLIETNYKDWTGTAIVQAFMSNPNALKIVRDNLIENNKKVWGYLRNDLKNELNKGIWDESQIEKIDKTISLQNNESKKKNKILTIIILLISMSIYFYPKIIRFINIDICLDSGSSWNYDINKCEE